MDDSTNPYPESADSIPWQTLWDLMLRASDALGEHSDVDTYMPPILPPSSDSQEDRQSKIACQWDLLYSSEHTSIVQGFRQFLESGAWGQLTRKQRYLARWMLGYIQSFLETIETDIFDSGGKTIFPFPKAPPEKVALWLVDKWFYHGGFHRASRLEALRSAVISIHAAG